MINIEKLKKIVTEYKKTFTKKQWNEENYKWKAVKQFQDNWDVNAADFSKMLTTSLEKTGNLLASDNNFPRLMIETFAKVDVESTREMFINLFDENKPLAERIDKFQTDADILKKQYDAGKWKNHYQNTNAISTYLWLRYPEKYYIYKYSEYVVVAEFLESNFVPKRTKSAVNVCDGFKLYDEIGEYLREDTELKGLLHSVLTEDCYPDSMLKTLTIDVGFYISHTYSKKNPTSIKKDDWFPTDYTPGFSVENWVELLNNPNIFTPDSLIIMKRMKDIGGEATCTQLAKNYGEPANFYNKGSSALAKRIAKFTKCPVMIRKYGKQNQRWWTILFLGKNAEKNNNGCYVWKLREELSKALDHIDLSKFPLYETIGKDTTESSKCNFFWLTANPKIWSFSKIEVGQEISYTLFGENGKKRRIFNNFLNAKVGDLIIGYESSPKRKIVALCQITKENDGKKISLKKIEDLFVPIQYSSIKSYQELQKMEFLQATQGSLFKLTKEEYEFILKIIRENNPLMSRPTCKPYSTEDFLHDVFMQEGKYKMLVSLLRNKKNLILQGAPGVGKTYVAKRLAYSIIGSEDDSRIEFIQFHQNYSYEDFIMGYKPNENGFELKDGVFYRFCQKAEKQPDKDFFFIIDEINRGNMSKIFGELLLLIEKDYRGKKMTLAYKELLFSVPENVYIIGMMNTADRSLAMIDYALRRRFCFFDMAPGFGSNGFMEYLNSLENETFKNLILKIKDLNEEIINDASLGDGFCIGHSYFCNWKQGEDIKKKIKEVIEHEIIPMLKEYWFDEINKAKKWEEILKKVIND